jgi:hypothetical protein
MQGEEITEGKKPGEAGSILFTSLPMRVARRYQEVLLVRELSPTACAILTGSTLEAICTQEQIIGGTLPEKLTILAQRRHLPPILLDLAQQLRYLRNIGSHEAEEDTLSEDIPAMLAALQALLDYLYILPTRLKALEARLQQHMAEKKRRVE